jgi:hypothetical protein
MTGRQKESVMDDVRQHESADGSGQTIERVRETLDRIHAALRGLRYGSVTAIVQDGVVVQVERLEKFRVERRKGAVG